MTIDKERLRVLAEAATPGPWILLPVEDGSPYLRVRGTRLGARYKVANVLAPTYFMPRDGIESTANAEFIAAARDAVPALLSENAALAAEVERLRKDAGHAEPMTRFCPGCGSVGEVPKKYRDCCPDGGDSRVIPTNLANKCHDLFQGALQAAMADKGGATS